MLLDLINPRQELLVEDLELLFALEVPDSLETKAASAVVLEVSSACIE